MEAPGKIHGEGLQQRDETAQPPKPDKRWASWSNNKASLFTGPGPLPQNTPSPGEHTQTLALSPSDAYHGNKGLAWLELLMVMGKLS